RLLAYQRPDATTAGRCGTNGTRIPGVIGVAGVTKSRPGALRLHCVQTMATTEVRTESVLTLTARAAEKIRGLMADEPAGEAEVLRVAIQGGGCSGFEYAL